MSGGGKGGGQVVGYKYYLGMHMALCHGPVDAITRITVAEKVAWEGSATGGTISINAPGLFGGDGREGGVSGNVDVLLGGPTQGVNAYLQRFLGAIIPAFRGVTSLVLNQCYLGNNPYLKFWAIRAKRIQVRQNGLPQWYSAKADVNGDMNPAHIVREVLTDPDWGMGYAESDIDDTSFAAAADTLFSEGMGISILWDKSMQLQDFMALILQHIDAALYLDRSTGKFCLNLARGGYTVSSLPLLNEDNIKSVADFKRKSVGELVNQVTVTYWDKSTGQEGSVTVQDIALVAQQRATVSHTIKYPGFTNGTIATRVASRDLSALSTPFASATIYADRSAALFNIGNVFRFSWADYGISQLVFRVTNVELGNLADNLVKLTVVEDVFSLGSAIYAPPPGSAWANPVGNPLPAVHQKVYEIPYYLIARYLGDASAQALSPTASYLMSVAANPGNGSINAQVWVDDGAGYEQKAILHFSSYATTNLAYPREVLSTMDVGSQIDADLVSAGDLCIFDTGSSYGEVCEVVSFSNNTLVVNRGVLDTIPANIPAGASIYFIERGELTGYDTTEYISGELLKAKILPSTGYGTLAIASAAQLSLTMGQRQFLPLPPGNFKISGVRYPTVISDTGDMSVSWSHRDRLQQTAKTITLQTDGNIGPEAGVSYRLKIYDETGTLKLDTSSLAGTSFTYTNELSDLNHPVSAPSGIYSIIGGSLPTDFLRNKTLRVVLSSVRGGLESTQKFDETVTRNLTGYGYAYGNHYGGQ